MSNSDPSFHRQAEQRFIGHIERLRGDDRLKIETTRGRKSVAPSRKVLVATKRTDQALGLKRLMIEMGKADRELQDRMPIGEAIELQVKRKRFLLPAKTIGTLRAFSTSPVRELVNGARFGAMSKGVLQAIVKDELPGADNAPVTLVILSTSGFTADAKAMVDGKDVGVILVEPNEAGGFSVYGPAWIDKELFDPEADADKRQRVRDAIEAGQMELSGSGVAADKITAKTSLPAQLVEAELRSYAKEHAGLVAKKLDGRMVLFREGTVAAVAPAAGGVSVMPMIDKVRALFSLRGQTEKKIAFLSERRAALGQQRDRAYEEITTLEQQESARSNDFASASPITQQKIAVEIARLRADAGRKREMLTALEKQLDIVNEGLHTLEMNRQLAPASLEKLAEATGLSEGIEEGLAALDAMHESVPARDGGLEMTDAAQAVFEELKGRSAATGSTAKENALPGAATTNAPRAVPPVSSEKDRKRAEPEAG